MLRLPDEKLACFPALLDSLTEQCPPDVSRVAVGDRPEWSSDAYSLEQLYFVPCQRSVMQTQMPWNGTPNPVAEGQCDVNGGGADIGEPMQDQRGVMRDDGLHALLGPKHGFHELAVG